MKKINLLANIIQFTFPTHSPTQVPKGGPESTKLDQGENSFLSFLLSLGSDAYVLTWVTLALKGPRLCFHCQDLNAHFNRHLLWLREDANTTPN